tara:strand:- start:372 stop:653 length:282 start_codon:yes stop_codon:yes gene_type:complete
MFVENKNMNKEHLLIKLKQVNKIQITQRMLFDIPEFKTGREVTSMESLSLALGRHHTPKNYIFDIIKFETWCKENSLRFYLDELQQVVHLTNY